MIVCFNLVHIRHLQGRDDEAHAYIQMAVEARPDHPLTYQSLSWIQEILGYRDDAMASLRRSISLYRGYEPERGVAHQRLANFLASSGRVEEAIEHYRHALSCRPADRVSLERLGRLLLRLGRSTEAIEMYLEWIGVDAANATAHYNLGVVYQQLGRLREAEASYRKAVRLAPGDGNKRNNLAVLLMMIGRPSEAIAQFEAAVKLAPDDPGARLNLGLALARFGRRERAMVEFCRALELQPDMVVALRTLSRLLATGQEASAHELQQAIDYAERACALTDRMDPVCLDILAIALAADGRFDRAVEVATRAAELASASGQADLATRIRRRIETYKQLENQPDSTNEEIPVSKIPNLSGTKE